MQYIFKPNRLGTITILIVILIIAFKNRNKLKSLLSFKSSENPNTWDAISDKRIATLHPSIQDKAREFINTAYEVYGIKLRVTSALRTWEEQTKLYNKGRSVPGQKVTNAKAGQSYHNYGLALDVVEIKNGKALWVNPNWYKIGTIGKSFGFTWGGDWKSIVDKPHFQMTFGKHYSQLAQLYKQGKRNGDYVILV